MAYARFGPCPHCKVALSYLEGVTGSHMNPKCPACRTVITVSRATFLMRDNSGPTLEATAAPRSAKSPA